VHQQYSKITRFTPESPILSNLQCCRLLEKRGRKKQRRKGGGKKKGNKNNNNNTNTLTIRDNTQHHMILMTQIIIKLRDLFPLPTYKNRTSRQHSTSYIHYLHTNTSLQIHIHASRVHCGSVFESGPSGLPYYCTPPVCVPAGDEIGALFN